MDAQVKESLLSGLNEGQLKDLKLVPQITEGAIVNVNESTGLVEIKIKSTGWIDTFEEKFFHRINYKSTKLEDIGSFIIKQVDGLKTFEEIADLVGDEFGEDVEPLYERFLDYVRALWERGFIEFLGNEKK